MGVVRELVDEQWRRQVPPGGRGIRRLHRALVAQGVDGVIAAALLRETAERLGPGARLDAALAGTLVTAPAAATPSVRLFFGPPGDGKTTTIAKLAAQARRAGRRVLLVGADTYRIGAAAELERYGQALGAEVRRAKDPAELGHALRDHGRADLVLIDTAGAGPAQQAELAEVKALADAAGADAGRTLVVSAATGALAAAHTWRAFAALGPDACVLTKADTAPGGPHLARLRGPRARRLRAHQGRHRTGRPDRRAALARAGARVARRGRPPHPGRPRGRHAQALGALPPRRLTRRRETACLRPPSTSPRALPALRT